MSPATALGMAPNLALALATLGVGWFVLWPARTRLGTLGYHVSAFPVGLLVWPAVAAVASALGSPYRSGLILLGVASYLALGFALMSWTARHEESGPPVRLWSYLLWGYAFYRVSAFVVARSLTRVTADSYMFYESYGVWLHDTGLLSAPLVGTRAPLLPSLSAANRWWGGDWTYSIYPIIAIHVLLLVAYATYRAGSTRPPTPLRGVVAVGAAILMGISGVFAVQWLLVHTHTASAVYLALAILGVLVVALAPPGGELSPHRAPALATWSALAGLATAGLVLARPDGLAYAFVPASLFVCACLRRGPDWRTMGAFFVPAAGFPALVLAGTFVRHGLWVQEGKLGGSYALALLVLLSAMPLVTAGIRRAWGERFRGRDLALTLSLALSVLVVAAVILLDPRESLGTLATMRANLLHEGSNGSMWYFLLAVPAVSILAGLWIEDRAVRWLTAAFLQFFAVAVAIHVLMHPGRIGWGDSFNRVSFHAVAIGFMLLGTSVLASAALLHRHQAPVLEPSSSEAAGTPVEA